jgi:hypothetical protein
LKDSLEPIETNNESHNQKKFPDTDDCWEAGFILMQNENVGRMVTIPLIRNHEKHVTEIPQELKMSVVVTPNSLVI